MAGNVVKVELSVQDTSNSIKARTKEAKALNAELGKFPTGTKTGSSAVKASYMAASDESRDYGRTRGAVGTGAAGRDFAKQSQGLGGLVGLYATFAANIFAVGAAYEALNKAAATERLAKATEMMSVQVGVNLKSISKNLIEASGQALSFEDAMQFTNIGTSAGLAGKQIESLTKIARGAASALGRDVNDSVRRIIQGTAKQEQEILDELGIFVKAKQAYDKYAQQIGVKVEDLTGRQRTQAYADEVERLGEKWKEFAEIDDPFSRFAATGKNALNELLTSVNSLLKPVLSFLADSKDGIQAIIALVSITLTKRALPELGSLFNNIFNYDKLVSASKAQEILTDVRNTRQALAKEMLATKAELETIAKSITLSKDSIGGLTGTLASSKGTRTSPGVAGISTTRLATAILGSETNPKDLALLKSTEVVEGRILTILNAQVASKTSSAEAQNAYIKNLVAQGVIEEGSSTKNLVLSNKSKALAAEIYTISSAEVANETKKVALSEKLVALKKEEAYQAEREAKAGAFTQKGSSTIPRQQIQAFSLVSAAVPESTATAATATHTTAINTQTIALAKNTAATEIKAIANANLAISAKLAAEGAQNITTAYGAGFSLAGLWAGLKQTGIEMKTQLLQMRANILGLGELSLASGAAAKGQFMLSASWLAGSAVAKTLGLAVKGLMGAISMLLMPLTVLMTVWSLFGEKIATVLPESLQAALGIGATAEAAKKAEEAQKSYNESLEISTKNLAMLADMKASGKVETLAEEADIEQRLASSLKERLSLMLKVTETAKAESEANKRRAEEIRIYGENFSEASLNAKELSRILSLANHPELAQQAKDIANSYQELQTKLGLRIISQEEYNQKIAATKVREEELARASYTSQEQRSSSASKAAASLQSMEDALNKVAIANKKAGDAARGLTSGEAVTFYNSFIGVLDKTGSSATGVASMFGILNNAIVAGGQTAALALPIFVELAGVMRTLAEGGVGAKETEAYLAVYTEKVLAPKLKALANTVGTPAKSTKTIKEYTAEAKEGFRSIQRSIEATKLGQLQLDREFANTSALQKRNDSVLGYQSLETSALEKSNALRKASTELTLAQEAAQLELRKTLDSKTRSEVEKTSAKEAYANAILTAQATKAAADQNADLVNQTNNSTTAIAALTKSYELLNLQQANSAAERNREFTLNELDISYRNELANLSDSELTKEAYAATIRKAKYDQTKETTKAEEEYARAVNSLALKEADQNVVAVEVKRLLLLKEEGLKSLAIQYGLTAESAQRYLDKVNTDIANKGDWTKGAVDGLKEYEKSAMDVAGNTKQAFTEAFKGMENALTDFAMTGKLDFNSLANSIITDMVRIAVQQSITGPLAAAAMSLFGFSTGGVFPDQKFAKGGAFDQASPTMEFAKGGQFTNSIVSSPTLFKFAQGTGLMGEAGPEAIMPLKRDNQGNLGVRATPQAARSNITVNIVESKDKAGQVEQRQNNNGEDMITVFVEKVKTAVAADITRGSGQIPSALNRTYGLNRVAGAY